MLLLLLFTRTHFEVHCSELLGHRWPILGPSIFPSTVSKFAELSLLAAMFSSCRVGLPGAKRPSWPGRQCKMNRDMNKHTYPGHTQQRSMSGSAACILFFNFSTCIPTDEGLYILPWIWLSLISNWDPQCLDWDYQRTGKAPRGLHAKREKDVSEHSWKGRPVRMYPLERCMTPWHGSGHLENKCWVPLCPWLLMWLSISLPIKWGWWRARFYPGAFQF